MASATCTSVGSVPERPGLASPEATLSASNSEVFRWVGRIASTARRSWRGFSVKLCFTSAASLKAITMPTSPGPMRSIVSNACRFASSRRDGSTSVACMLAELSIRKMNLPPGIFSLRQPGWSSDSMTSPITANCRNKSRLRRSRCQIVLT